LCRLAASMGRKEKRPVCCMVYLFDGTEEKTI
jgi:hypothetical protein